MDNKELVNDLLWTALGPSVLFLGGLLVLAIIGMIALVMLTSACRWLASRH